MAANPIRAILPGVPPDQIWTQIGGAEAELDDETILRFRLRKPLERLAKALLEQMKKEVTQEGNPVVGIKITNVGFQRLFGFSDYERKEEARKKLNHLKRFGPKSSRGLLNNEPTT